ncbi:golgin subfamily A member 6-like protein 6 [Nasonia vitripennis]|uniref:Uncharacterized protein n=1 Tax=Nasonia vitripennis TaxID=7425 RepID=A0A7M7T6K4_NASVI|nr:golgin subfamily A member 6-like protein 6 [Nasonia vitripennis]
MRKIESVVRELKEELKSGKEKMEAMEEKVESLESTVAELNERLTAATERQAETSAETGEERFDAGATEGARGSTWSLRSGTSMRSMRSGRSRARSGNSWGSGASDAFSGREVSLMKKMLYDKDRAERACNIVVKGLAEHMVELERLIGKKDEVKDWVEKLIEEKLGTEVKVETARIGGGRSRVDRVVIAKLRSEEEKRKVMKNKSKLRGTNIYIEHDLSYEEKRKQKEIKRWCMEKQRKGWNIRIGIGRVAIDGQWIRWEEEDRLKEIEAEDNKRQEKVTKQLEWMRENRKENRSVVTEGEIGGEKVDGEENFE